MDDSAIKLINEMWRAFKYLSAKENRSELEEQILLTCHEFFRVSEEFTKIFDGLMEQYSKTNPEESSAISKEPDPQIVYVPDHEEGLAMMAGMMAAGFPFLDDTDT